MESNEAGGKMVQGKGKQIVWMGWPYDSAVRSDFTNEQYYDQSQSELITLIKTILKYSDVNLICINENEIPSIKASLGESLHHITYITDLPIDDNWTRDICPTFRINSNGLMDCFSFRFNGWGQRMKHQYDALLAERIAKYLDITHEKSFLVGEGGGVINDGDGTLIANESSWLHQNKNPNLSRDEIEKQLLRLYGAKKMIWCPGVRDKDMTDCHIDNEVAFTGPGKIIITRPNVDCKHPLSESARVTYQILKNERDAQGRTFEIAFLDEPTSFKIASDYEYKVITYVNYLELEEAVINVSFGCQKGDLEAEQTLRKAYPLKKIEMIQMGYTYGFREGGIHCLTHQQPIPAKIIPK